MTNSAAATSATPTASYRTATVTIGFLLATILGLELIAGRFEKASEATDETTAAPTFTELPRGAFPPPAVLERSGPKFLIVGNSHLYSLPSPTAGRPLQVGSRNILPD